jgi:phosphatidylserine decarboxylase
MVATAVPVALLGWKWELGSGATAWRALLLGVVNAVLAGAIGLEHPLAVAAFCWVALAVEIPVSILPFFYRDPERSSPGDPGAILSPADGHVVYVKRITSGNVPVCSKKGRDFALEELAGVPGLPQEGYVIGIGMTFLDVHVNRAPIGGRITALRRIPGRFMSLKRPDAVAVNERLSMVLSGEGVSVAVVLIASRLVRRIVPFVGEGDLLRRGDRIGMIRLGSQVDLVLPLDAVGEPEVKEGDVVRAGVTVIARTG